MILKTTGADVAMQALTGDYIGTPYSELDCQGFVEQVLKDLGVRKPDGTPYNWRGSNSMFRNFILWRGTKADCIRAFGYIPKGAFVFIVKNDGGEKEKGYDDDLGNVSHVGIYTGQNPKPCIDSQPTGGVQNRSLDIFTHVGLMSMVDYDTYSEPESIPEKNDALKAIRIIRDDTSSDMETLDALKTLTKYLKEDNI